MVNHFQPLENNGHLIVKLDGYWPPDEPVVRENHVSWAHVFSKLGPPGSHISQTEAFCCRVVNHGLLPSCIKNCLSNSPSNSYLGDELLGGPI